MKLQESRILYFFIIFSILLLASHAMGMEKSEPLLIALFLDGEEESTIPGSMIYEERKIPISHELSIYLKQCFCPIIVSRNLLHTIITYRGQFVKDRNIKGTFSEIFISKKKEWSKKKYITTQYASNATNHSIDEDKSMKTLFNSLIGAKFAYFTTTIPFHEWQIYPLANDTSLYLLIPNKLSSQNSTEILSQKIAYTQLEQDIFSFKTEKDTQPIRNNIYSGLIVLKAALNNPKIVITLTGHGSFSGKTSLESCKQLTPQLEEGCIACLPLCEFRNLLKTFKI